MRRVLPLSLLFALLLAGCGDDEQPAADTQVRKSLKTFSTAVADRDYRTICEDVFAPELLEGLQQIGLPCEVAMRNSLGDLEQPRLTVGAISVDKDTATAEVKTSAKGQPPSSDTLQLKQLEGQWRVAALSTPEDPEQEEQGPTGPAAETASPAASPKPTD